MSKTAKAQARLNAGVKYASHIGAIGYAPFTHSERAHNVVPDTQRVATFDNFRHCHGFHHSP